MSLVRYLSVMIVAIALFGCGGAVINKVETKDPIDVTYKNKLATMQFASVDYGISRGTIVGRYEFIPFHCWRFSPHISFDEGRLSISDLYAYPRIFYQTMNSANFNVLGYPAKIFKTKNDKKPDIYVGARINYINMNVCDRISAAFATPLGVQEGEATIKVKWELYSNNKEKIIYETETKGYAKIDSPHSSGEIVLVDRAFAEATKNLAADTGFYKTLMDYRPSMDSPIDEKNPDMTIKNYALFKNSITDNIDDIRLGVVTVSVGDTFGTGVFITKDLILTNHHVVGGNDLVKIQLLTGRNFTGEVIRRNYKRDVALIQVETGGYNPIPIRLKHLKITEEIYAIGNPLSKRYKATVTKGIVSRFDRNKHGLEDIQSDLDVQGGNSGGPLLDKNGNLVGLTYAGIGKHSIGMNYFIPIHDALKKLDVSIRGRYNP